ncbi:MAG: hypothetical protein H6739_24780 [Alphaproteobacteria bacterium]|nr:hypothetical protein [Alphaproteobacteria bacterium]
MTLTLLLLSCSLFRTETDSPLPRDFRACAVDSDCVVAPSLAGLDHIPTSRDGCLGECYVGINKAHAELWAEEVERLAPDVPCTKEFEACPPADDWFARCRRGTCEVVWWPPQ